jgi:hypothetical protein
VRHSCSHTRMPGPSGQCPYSTKARRPPRLRVLPSCLPAAAVPYSRALQVLRRLAVSMLAASSSTKQHQAAKVICRWEPQINSAKREQKESMYQATTTDAVRNADNIAGRGGKVLSCTAGEEGTVCMYVCMYIQLTRPQTIERRMREGKFRSLWLLRFPRWLAWHRTREISKAVETFFPRHSSSGMSVSTGFQPNHTLHLMANNRTHHPFRDNF